MQIVLSIVLSCNYPETDEVLFEDKKIKISTFPLSHGMNCTGFLFEEKNHSENYFRESSGI